MRPLESVPAVRRLGSSNEHVFAVEIHGHATSADIENLYGLLEGAFTLHEELDLIVRFVDCDGVDWSDVARNTTREGRLQAHDHIGRCAIVGEPDLARQMREFLALGSERETRLFLAGDEPEAWRWLDATEIVEKV